MAFFGGVLSKLRGVGAAARAAGSVVSARAGVQAAEEIAQTSIPGVMGSRTAGRFFGLGGGATARYFHMGSGFGGGVREISSSQAAGLAKQVAARGPGRMSNLGRKVGYGILGGAAVVGGSSAIIGLKGRSSGGTGRLPSQNYPMM